MIVTLTTWDGGFHSEPECAPGDEPLTTSDLRIVLGAAAYVIKNHGGDGDERWLVDAAARLRRELDSVKEKR